MKRLGMLVLLISLGVNLGLGIHVWRESREDVGGPRGSRFEGRREHARPWPARRDTAAWNRMEERRMERMTAGLGLDPDQARRLRENQRETVQRLAARREAIHELRGEVRDLLAADPVDTAAVRTVLGEMGRRQAELDSLVAESILRDLATLAPEQRTRYLRMLPYEEDRRGGRRHHRGEGRVRQ